MMLLVALAGGFGALARAGADKLAARDGPPAWRATLAVNILGSFLLGLASQTLTGSWLAIAGTGFLGGFTTFSSASWQVARELGKGNRLLAFGLVVGTTVGCLLAAWGGTHLGAQR